MSEPTQPPFDDVVLVAYIDDTLDAAQRQAVEASPTSLARVAVLRQELDAVARGVARALCPGADHLAAFLFGELGEDQERAVGAHVAWCGACGEELAASRLFLQDIARDLEPGAGEAPTHGRLRWLVTAIGGALAGGRSPAERAMALPTAGLRGGASEARTIEVEGLRIVITTEDDPTDPSLRSLSAIVFPADDALDAMVGDWSAALIDADGVSRDGRLDDLGEIAFHGLSSARYTLMLIQPELRVLVPGLDV